MVLFLVLIVVYMLVFWLLLVVAYGFLILPGFMLDVLMGFVGVTFALLWSFDY